MATTITSSATGGTTQASEKALAEVLTRIQGMYIPDRFWLIWEDWDWLVVLQCLQDHNLFLSHPKRPPLGAFVKWLHQHNIPELRTRFSVYQMSLASRQLGITRYPWTGCQWHPGILRRWRSLYRHLDRLLNEPTDE